MRQTHASHVPLALVLLATGCAGPPADPVPTGLAYGEPDPNPARYAFSDSATFAIEAPGYGVMEVTSAQEGLAELEFQRAPNGYAVRVHFQRFEGTVRNAEQRVSRSDESDIAGPVGVELSFTGAITVVDTPAVTPSLREVAGPESLVRPLFVRLPGRAVTAGDRWVDTVHTRDEAPGTVSTGTSIITSTLLGDTLVAGRRVLRIATETETAVEIVGTAGDVAIEQRLRGTLRGRILWDAPSRVLVERLDEGELSGGLDMPGTGAPTLPLSASVRRRVSLLP